MRYKYFILLYLYLFAFLMGPLAQPTPHFLEELTRHEGLSSNKINDILQDDDGFLWIATTDGLNRFDGTEIVQFYHHMQSASLSHNYIFCLEKLKGNWLAIGTQGGLSFMNTRTSIFENFCYEEEGPLQEYNNIIIDLAKDALGNLWAVSRNSIFVFDANRKLVAKFFSTFTAEDATRLRLKFVEKMIPLSNGDMLIYRFDGWHIYNSREIRGIPLERWLQWKKHGLLSELERLRITERNNLYFPPANIFPVFRNFFLCIKPGADSLLLLDENGKHLSAIYFPYNRFPFLSWSQKLVSMDSSRVLFLFHSYGFSQLYFQWKKQKPQLKECSELLFPALEFETAYCDRQQNWWLGTAQSGLRKVSPFKQQYHKFILPDKEGKPNKSETVSISRYKSNLWISTYGDGFYRNDLKEGKINHYFLNSGDDPWPNHIWNVRQFHADSLWLGTQSGLFWYCLSTRKHGRVGAYPGKPNVIEMNAVTTQFADSRGRIWLGIGRGNGICSFDPESRRFDYYRNRPKNNYPLRYPTQIVEDGKSNLWFVNDGSSDLVYWTRSTDEFHVVKIPVDSRRELSDLTAICIENDSVLWIGTLADGLVRFETTTGNVRIFGQEKGIGDSHVNGIFIDQSKRVWVSTFGNLSCLDQETGMFANYTEKDGLPVEFPTCQMFYEDGAKAWYGAGHGILFRMHPDQMNMPQQPQKTIITAMKVNGESFMFMETEGRFRPSQNNITIYYAAIDLTNGPQTKYAYKLVGDDTAWVMAGNQRQINFSNLAPGHYTFMVKAANNMGLWSDDAAMIRFSINRKFSQTGWFYGAVILAMGLVFYGMYRFRVRQLMRTEQMRSEISRNLHDEVGSSLTNISLGTLLAQKQIHNQATIKSILERIYQDSQHVSESMREIIWSINPKIDTLDEALPRMLQYATELLEAQDMEVMADIAPGVGQMKLSMQQRRDLYLIFKECINNLARHSQATKVRIAWEQHHHELTMLVEDNGIGFEKVADSGHNGLKNMRERAAKHGWKFSIYSMPGEGTTVRLQARIA